MEHSLYSAFIATLSTVILLTPVFGVLAYLEYRKGQKIKAKDDEVSKTIAEVRAASGGKKSPSDAPPEARKVTDQIPKPFASTGHRSDSKANWDKGLFRVSLVATIIWTCVNYLISNANGYFPYDFYYQEPVESRIAAWAPIALIVLWRPVSWVINWVVRGFEVRQ